MSKYLVILGREALLCASECASVLEWQVGARHLEALAPHVLFVDTNEELEPGFFDAFGGIVRVARCIGTVPEFSAPALLSQLDSVLESLSAGEKIVFGLSLFADGKSPGRESVAAVLAALKEGLRERGFSCRYMEPHEKQTVLSSAQVGESKMLDKGFELVVVKKASEWLVGSTGWIQDYSSQRIRDYDRPRADPRSGMLPPKLARIMVNLARGPETKTLLDPFCGNGSILMEASLLGLSPIGLDRDLDAVKSAQENCDWLCRITEKSLPEVRYSQGDATEMRHYFDWLSIDCVATEPYLGPPLSKGPSSRHLKQILNDLSGLYREVLAEIRIVTRPGGRVVFVTPCFRDSHGDEQSAPVGSLIRLAGYRPIYPLRNVRRLEKLSGSKEALRHAQAGVLHYSRPDQRVTRRIHVLRT